MDSPKTTVTEPRPSTGIPPRLRAAFPWPILGCALLSGLLLFFCHFPLAWGWLAWVALVPFFCLIRAGSRPLALYACAGLGSAVYFFLAMQWMRVADIRMYVAWFLLTIYCSLVFVLGLLLLRLLDRRTRLPLVLTAPVVWVALEYFRSFFATGFAWYYLSHTQHDFLAVIQISDLAGAYAVTFLVAAVNAWLFEFLFLQEWFLKSLHSRSTPGEPTYARGPGRLVFPMSLALQGGFLLFLVGGSVLYGMWRLEQGNFTPGPRVAVLQGNLDVRLRNKAALPGNDLSKLNVMKHYEVLCLAALRHPPAPELILWPETSFPADWAESAKNLPVRQIPEAFRNYEDSIKNLMRNLTRQCPAYHLIGMNAEVLNEQRKIELYNSAILVEPTGQVTARYDKIHPLPFGEYVPFKDWLPLMKVFSPYENDYSIRAGEHFTRVKLGPYHLGVLICFEDSDPKLARQYGRPDADGPAVDFLVNISNDGWFDGTSEHEEHLAISRFRAIEARRPLVRSVNMGISAVIDGNGRVLQPAARKMVLLILKDKQKIWGASLRENGAEVILTDELGNELPMRRDEVKEHFTLWDWHIGAGLGTPASFSPGDWHTAKKTAGVLRATIPLDHRESFYAQAGDWLPQGCWLILAGGLAWSWRRRK